MSGERLPGGTPAAPEFTWQDAIEYGESTVKRSAGLREDDFDEDANRAELQEMWDAAVLRDDREEANRIQDILSQKY